MVLALGGVGLNSIGAAFAAGFPSLVATRLLAGAFGAFGPASIMAAIGEVVPV